jgi:dTMP kinase
VEGIFITIEGIDGVGKTTQLKLLKEWFEGRKMKVLFTREPGGTAVGEKIREFLLDREYEGLTPWAEVLLYAASRAQLLEEVIRPALNSGEMVICDRFLDSTIAYQGFGRGIPLAYIRKVNNQLLGGIIPHLTLLLDLGPNMGRARRENEGERPLDRLEGENVTFYHRVREGYLQLAQREPERIKLIDATASIETVRGQVIGEIEKLLENSSGRC